MKSGNLFAAIPDSLQVEFTESLAAGAGSFHIERIVSRGHSSPDGFWYEQASSEWVVLLTGSASLEFRDSGETLRMKPGDWIEIEPFLAHRVTATSPTEESIWLALHWSEGSSK
jgi:cupin 2 domain-containing protein